MQSYGDAVTKVFALSERDYGIIFFFQPSSNWNEEEEASKM